MLGTESGQCKWRPGQDIGQQIFKQLEAGRAENEKGEEVEKTLNYKRHFGPDAETETEAETAAVKTC